MNQDDADKNATFDDSAYAEKRQHPRYDVSISVDYSSGENFLFSYIQNISEMGIFIRSDSPMEKGTELMLRFGKGDEAPLEIQGEVVWVNPVRENGDNINPGMGVRFKGMTPEIREKVVSLIRTVAYLRQ